LAVATDLRRGCPRTYEYSWRRRQREQLAQLTREQLRLVITPEPTTLRVQRNRDHDSRGDPFDHKSLRHQLRQRRREPFPAFVLEPVHGCLDGAFVRDRRAESGQGPETRAAAAVSARRLHLHPASPAQRLFETPDPGATACAQPRADPPASAAPRRQQEIEDVHETSVWNGSTGS
jgi:hypothetical protein